jgi:hypothetical protein
LAVSPHNTSNPSQAHQKGIQKCFLNQRLIKVKTVAGTAMSEMFNRNVNGVRAHADGVGIKRANVSFEAV